MAPVSWKKALENRPGVEVTLRSLTAAFHCRSSGLSSESLGFGVKVVLMVNGDRGFTKYRTEIMRRV